MIAAHKIELIVSAVLEPTADHGIRHPGAPAPLRRHAHPDVRHTEQDARRRQRKKNARQEKYRRAVALFQRVEDFAIPQIDAELRGEVCKDQDNKAAGQNPGQPVAAVAAPEAARRAPKAIQQIFSSKLFLVAACERSGCARFRDRARRFGNIVDRPSSAPIIVGCRLRPGRRGSLCSSTPAKMSWGSVGRKQLRPAQRPSQKVPL